MGENGNVERPINVLWRKRSFGYTLTSISAVFELLLELQDDNPLSPILGAKLRC